MRSAEGVAGRRQPFRALIALVSCAGLGAAGPTPAQERPEPATVVLVADCALDATACAAARTAIEGLSTIPRRRPGLSALLVASALVAWEAQARRAVPSRAERDTLPPRG